jgi:mannan endo-1,4-beta-mannosidase
MLRKFSRRHIIFSCAILTVLIGIIVTVSVVALNRTSSASAHFLNPFVTRFGTKFIVNGKSFQVAGSNNYYPIYKPQVMVDDLFANAEAMGLNVMRVWGFNDIGSLDGTTVPTISGNQLSWGVGYFQYWDTTTNSVQFNDGTDGLQRLDYVIQSAKAHHIKLILPLTNNWKDYGGMDQYLTWFNLTYHDEFYTNNQAQSQFMKWIKHIVNHVNSISGVAYKNDPTIMAWELGNEPRCKGSSTSASADCKPATITNWAKKMSNFIKFNDHNHLVSVGDEGFFNRTGSTDWFYSGGEGVDSDALAALPSIDFVTYHLYPQYWGTTVEWGTQYINDHTELGNKVHKPSLLEEFGLKDPITGDTRQQDYTQWLNALCTGHSNWTFWILSARDMDWSTGGLGGLYPDYDGFTIWYHDLDNKVTPDGAFMSAQAQRFIGGKCAAK